MSLEKYNQLEKAARNNEYLAMIDRGIAQLEAGKGQEHELFEIKCQNTAKEIIELST